MVRHPLYNALLQDLPDDVIVEKVIQGRKWTLVKAGNYCGIALSDHSGRQEAYEDPLGLSLKDLGQWILSWDFSRASIGLAAINAYYSHEEQLKNYFPGQNGEVQTDLREELQSLNAGSLVSSIGGFPFLKSLQKQRVQVFELKPGQENLPPQAIEFELKASSILLITGSTIINKTMPRILELSQGIPSFVLGPSTAMHPSLFQGGIQRICGLQILDPEIVMNLVASSASSEVIQSEATRKIEFRKSPEQDQ